MNVCTLIVVPDLCVGCGVCVPVCPTGTLSMHWTPAGLCVPIDAGNCRKLCSVCVAACPFVDHPHNEDTLAQVEYGHLAGVRHTPQTGFYLGAYAGCVADEALRLQASSGGLARWFFAELLDRGIVDRVICVTNNSGHDGAQDLFSYALLETPDEVRSASGSAYYPVELSAAIGRVLAEEAAYALVGVPCFLKAVKLAMLQNVKLRKCIKATAALVCGQTKSKLYTEYLVRACGLSILDGPRVSFREKDPAHPANNYLFAATAGEGSGRVPFQTGARTPYCTGHFEPAACTFCDDVFGEVADVTFLDAWLPRYTKDWRGTNLVLTRSPLTDEVLREGAARGALRLETIDVEDVIGSQAGVLDTKRRQLGWRLWLADRAGRPHPSKRVPPRKPSVLQRRFVKAAEALRRESFRAMALQKAASAYGLGVYLKTLSACQRRYRITDYGYRNVDAYFQGAKRRLRRLLQGRRSQA